ncbi:hypothetical protein GRI43_12910 [Altererythrobacter luteolus]|uniref:Pre ATP-grasp domain-containing protein n=1 Tax=Pontixanthobacter luteolus TaxID=295089 RepID=A0A6I4V1W2_9SPHN|nr:hypothetical protein [Pontixanthobacter luteolus]MXP48289.1 hypothetical protein [Pontixanthobacter luteolus]
MTTATQLTRAPGSHVADGTQPASVRTPITPVFDIPLSPDQRRHISAVAAMIAEEDPRISRVPPLADDLATGQIDAPALLIEDHSGIQLAHDRGADANLSYRAMLLAADGDLVAVYGQRNRAFEEYCRDTLDLGDVEVIAPPLADPHQSLAQACLADHDLITRTVSRAKDHGGLNVIPYMATGGIWRLAGEIALRSGVPVRVSGPPPALMRAVNDKIWFARWAASLLGEDAIPHSRAVYGMGALAGYLRRFIQEHGRVAVKLTHSAASLGNIVLDSDQLTSLSPPQLAAQLRDMIEDRDWQNPFPVQVTAWEGPLAATPSAQLWIPHPEDGPPLVEGIFDQITVHENARFAGGIPSELPDAEQREIASQALRLGMLFQQLGYFGRCSFDAVLIAASGMGQGQENRLHWVECNGRWGGVSIPMTLASRLVGDWRNRALLITERTIADGRAIAMDEFLQACRPHLFRAGGDRNGAILLTPGRLQRGGFDLLLLGTDRADVIARERACLDSLTQ